jgi:hypothetical protein
MAFPEFFSTHTCHVRGHPSSHFLPALAHVENQWFSFPNIANQESRFALVTSSAFFF